MSNSMIVEFMIRIPDIPKDDFREYKSGCYCGGVITAKRNPFSRKILAECDKCGLKARD